jgi:deazaflavin-dependent oxidoreductase (nitroreductase family)
MQITLTTIGRRTGRPRPVTLYAWEDGEDRLVVVGSRGGHANDPWWAVNLREEPRATVTRGRHELNVQAREIAGSERERLWARVVAAFPLYARYQQKTERTIPLFVLEPLDE